MISMVSAGDKAQPIMQYVRHLEGLVRGYRAGELKRKSGSFALGLGIGAACGFGLWFVLCRVLHL